MKVRLPQDLDGQLSADIERASAGLGVAQRLAVQAVVRELNSLWNEHHERGGVRSDIAEEIDARLSPAFDRLLQAQDDQAAASAIDHIIDEWNRLRLKIESL